MPVLLIPLLQLPKTPKRPFSFKMAKEIKSQKEFQREMSQVEKDQKVVLYICNCPGCYSLFCNNGTNCKEFKVRKSCIGIRSKYV